MNMKTSLVVSYFITSRLQKASNKTEGKMVGKALSFPERTRGYTRQ